MLPMVCHPFTLSNLNTGISEGSKQILIKFYVQHHWGGGKSAYAFGTDQIKTGFHGNRKCPLTYNRENDVSMLTLSVLICSLSNLNVTRGRALNLSQVRILAR